ncbi:hypothetical protein ACWDOP_07520 [Nocardia sp. NPDC003693]
MRSMHTSSRNTLRFLSERDKYVDSFRVEFLTPAISKSLPA